MSASRCCNNTPVLIQKLAVAGVPVGIGEDRSVRADRVEKGADQRIGAVQQPSDPAEGRMDHRHVAKADAEAPEVLPQ